MSDGGVGVAEGANLVTAIDAIKKGEDPGVSIGVNAQKATETKPAATPETVKPADAKDTKALENAGAIDPAFQEQLSKLKVETMTPTQVRAVLGILSNQGSEDILTKLQQESQRATAEHRGTYQESQYRMQEEHWTDMLNHLKNAQKEINEEYELLKKGNPEEQAIALEIDNAYQRSNYSDAVAARNDHANKFIERKKKENPTITPKEIEALLATDPVYIDHEKKIAELKAVVIEGNKERDKLTGIPRKLEPLAKQLAIIMHGVNGQGPFTEEMAQRAMDNPMSVMKQCLEITIGNPEAADAVFSQLVEAGMLTNKDKKETIKALTADKKNRLPGRIFKGISLFALLMLLLLGRGFSEANAGGGGRR